MAFLRFLLLQIYSWWTKHKQKKSMIKQKNGNYRVLLHIIQNIGSLWDSKNTQKLLPFCCCHFQRCQKICATALITVAIRDETKCDDARAYLWQNNVEHVKDDNIPFFCLFSSFVVSQTQEKKNNRKKFSRMNTGWAT